MQQSLERYNTRAFKITDLIRLHVMYDSLSYERKKCFHPGFLGFKSINPNWFPSQILLLVSDIGFLKKALKHAFPRLVFLPLVVIIECDKRKEFVAFGFVKLRKRLPNGYFLADLGIVVKTAYQGKGLGYNLLGNLLKLSRSERVQEIFLTVLDENLRAIRLYRRYGFRKIGKTVEHWKGKVFNVSLMKKSLNSKTTDFAKKENS
jgi:ribosomal protein S18 acetylase RimI-like enzyme